MAASERLRNLEGSDVSSMSAGAAHAALRDIDTIRGATDQLEGATARRLAELNTQGQAGPVADSLARHGRTSRRHAERAERRADTLGHTPQLDAALSKGRVGTEHADTLASAATKLGDDHRAALFAHDRQLTELAASKSPDSFRRSVDKIVNEITADDGLAEAQRQVEATSLRTGINDDAGMYWFRLELAPEDGVRVRRAIKCEADALAKRSEYGGVDRDRLEGHAAANLITGARRASGVPHIDMVVTIPLGSLANTTPEGQPVVPAEYSDGTTMPVATARRHACEARIIPVVLDGHGMPLDVGRAKRLATPSQRAALRAMYRTCAVGNCDRDFDRCHIHHLLEWDTDLGPTDLANLVPVCSFHHHRAHEGRWQLQLDASSRQLTVRLPDGSLHSRSFPDVVAERAA